MTQAVNNVDLAARLDDLIEHIATGKILEAMEEFYTADTVMEEPAYGATAGLAENIEREKQFLASVSEWKGFDVKGKSVGDDVTMYEHTMDWVDVNGNDVHVEQVAVAYWRDGKIYHERFYYNMG